MTDREQGQEAAEDSAEAEAKVLQRCGWCRAVLVERYLPFLPSGYLSCPDSNCPEYGIGVIPEEENWQREESDAIEEEMGIRQSRFVEGQVSLLND